MRVSDSMLSNRFIENLNKNRERITELQTQIAKGTKINKPSDSPGGTTKLLRLSNQIGQSDTFSNNISNAQSFLDETVFSMESIQTETVSVLTKLTELDNATNEVNLGNYADEVDSAIKAILDSANSESGGKYIFGGTDFAGAPYGYTSDNANIELKVDSTSGKQVIRTSSTSTQKINMTGTEIFGTILTQNGSLNSAGAVGSVTNTSTQVYDNAGNAYTLNASYTKTAANEYSLTYDITDTSGTSVYSTPPAASTLKFDASTSKLISINGSDNLSLNITSPSKAINFSFNFTGFKETSGGEPLTVSANQKQDIFNTLITIRDNLRNGIKPTDEQIQSINDFNTRMLDKLSEAGNMQNRLTDTQELLNNHKLVLEDLVSKEQKVDTTKAVVDLQNQQYMLELSYKISASILPQSLLDYL